MSAHSEKTLDSTSGEEIAGTIIPPAASGSAPQRNAFTDLMSPRKKDKNETPIKVPNTKTLAYNPIRNTTFLGRDGLGAYIESPASFPASRVIYHDEKWVVINDLFPKSSIHLLLLARAPSKQLLHPFDAFQDLDFLKDVQSEIKKLRVLVAKELHRRYGNFSAQDQERQKVLDSFGEDMEEETSKNVLPGRDWTKSVISGIHIGPSMNHLHIHIISVDRHSECMRHRKHYNSFSTPFLVDVEDFPLGERDDRRHPGRAGFLKWDLKCWRCGKNFGNKFARLKEHLEDEFVEWRKE